MTKPRAKSLVIFTVGHSTRTAKEFVRILAAYGIHRLVDVRTIPKSRHNPQFNGTRLANTLKKAGIVYAHAPLLGGLRHAKKDSVNLGWRNTSFRGYADYMQTDGFEKGLSKLMKFARQRPTAIMCAEAVPWRCHRSLVADALKKKGVRVLHIMSATNAREHHYTPFLKVRKGKLIYPAIQETER